MVVMEGCDSGDRVRNIPIEEVHPSQENNEINGVINPDDGDLIDLANDIISTGIREPLQVSQDSYIVSGHGRYAAAGLAKLTTIPVVVLDIRHDDHESIGWMKVLRAYNHQRVKSSAVRMREAMLSIDPSIAISNWLNNAKNENGKRLPQS